MNKKLLIGICLLVLGAAVLVWMKLRLFLLLDPLSLGLFALVLALAAVGCFLLGCAVAECRACKK